LRKQQIFTKTLSPHNNTKPKMQMHNLTTTKENLMNAKNILIYFLICIPLLVSCASGDATPQLVASYPAENQIAVYPVTPPDMVVVYHATIDLEVPNVNSCVDKVNTLIYEYGGYLASSQSWYQGGEVNTTLVLAVPIIHFETVHRALLRLGDLVSERVSGELKPLESGAVEWQSFTYITLHLHPKDTAFSTLSSLDWRPAQTLTKAWHVFTAIFGFLVDIIIWVGVVAGPFIFLGWLAKRLIHRRKTAR
jgi:hypothetical protein